MEISKASLLSDYFLTKNMSNLPGFQFTEKQDMALLMAFITILALFAVMAFLFWKVPFDQTKPADGSALVIMFAGILGGSVIGAFSYVGIKQGSRQPTQQPVIQVPDGHELAEVNGILVVRPKE